MSGEREIGKSMRMREILSWANFWKYSSPKNNFDVTLFYFRHGVICINLVVSPF